MALFGKNEEKQAAKAAELLAKYGLENVSDPQTVAALKEITWTRAQSKWAEAGATLTLKAEDAAMLGSLRALVEQNFIIIRQLDKLTK